MCRGDAVEGVLACMSSAMVCLLGMVENLPPAYGDGVDGMLLRENNQCLNLDVCGVYEIDLRKEEQLALSLLARVSINSRMLVMTRAGVSSFPFQKRPYYYRWLSYANSSQLSLTGEMEAFVVGLPHESFK